ncbi:MAG: hypothetical protein IPK89_10350 [Sphingomonadales bacterium]|nr:hypothetical protein [Sphingomonadales bacterium]
MTASFDADGFLQCNGVLAKATAAGEPAMFSAGSFVVPENGMPFMAELFNGAPAEYLSNFPVNGDKVTQALSDMHAGEH